MKGLRTLIKMVAEMGPEDKEEQLPKRGEALNPPQHMVDAFKARKEEMTREKDLPSMTRSQFRKELKEYNNSYMG